MPGEQDLTDGTVQIAGLQPRQYLMLLELSKAIASHRNLSDLFRDLAARLHNLFDFNYLGVRLHDDSRNVMRLHILESSEPSFQQAPDEVPVEGSISGWVWQSQQPLVIRDVEKETRFPVSQVLRNKYPAKSFCGLPLTTAHQQLGVLVFASDKTGTYDQLDLEFAQLVGAQIAVAVDNVLNYETAQLYEQQLASERDGLRLLLDVNNAVEMPRCLRRGSLLWRFH
jgi:formate hydrogenlyase transcriptional activator